MNIKLRDISGFLIASRIPNLLIIAYTQFATAKFLMGIPGNDLYNLQFLGLLLSTAMIGAGGYIINDYFDQKIDMINRPDRVVVGPDLRRRGALFSHVILSCGGIALGVFTDPFIGLIHLFSTGVLWAYSGIVKRILLLSTLTISFLPILTMLLVMVFFREVRLLPLVYALFGGVTVFARETLKDIISSKGKQTFGIPSVSTMWEVRRVKRGIYVVCLVGISLLILYLLSIKNWTMRIFFLGLVPFMLWFLYRLIIADRAKDFKHLKLVADLIIVSGLVSMCLV